MYALISAIEYYLIAEREEWLQSHIISVCEFASTMESVQGLFDYCSQTMLLFPEITLASDEISMLRKNTLLAIIKNDDLDMDEENVWMLVLRWVIKQVPGLSESPVDWSDQEINTIKTAMTDFMPYIRFFNISSEGFSNQIIPYEDVLPKKLWHDLLHYHIEKKIRPGVRALPPRNRQQSPTKARRLELCLARKHARQRYTDKGYFFLVSCGSLLIFSITKFFLNFVQVGTITYPVLGFWIDLLVGLVTIILLRRCWKILANRCSLSF